MRTARATLPLLLALASQGCTSDDYARQDGLTFGAGDAIAANTVMQMVDPWPAGVQDTRLKVPAQRAASSASDAAAQAKAEQGGGGSAADK